MTGTWVGPGLVGQVEGNLLKSGRFRPDNYFITTPLLLQFGLVYIFSGLLEIKFDCPGFFWSPH